MLTVTFRAIQQRKTTPGHLRAALARRSRHEHRYVRDVHRSHHSPKTTFNQRQSDVDGTGNRYRDVWYLEQQVVVEVDGQEAHPREEGFRDRRRDNDILVTGVPTLRYGWVEIATDPCRVAEQVVTLLRLRGRRGAARACGPGCPVAPPIRP